MNAIAALRSAGFDIRLSDEPKRGDEVIDAILDVTAGEAKARFAVDVKARAPYPNEFPRFEVTKERLGKFGRPLLVVPFVSDPLATRLTDAGWSWADAEGNFDLRAPGLLLHQRLTVNPPRNK